MPDGGGTPCAKRDAAPMDRTANNRIGIIYFFPLRLLYTASMNMSVVQNPVVEPYCVS